MINYKQVLAAALAGTTLMCASGDSHALGFGRPISRAVLGDTLWITVPVRVDVGEEITDECLAADVYFGDDKVAASAVSASLIQGPGNERTLKVSTTALVNEPIVTVYMAAGCHARMTRKFVAFADPPSVNQATLAAGKATDVAEAVEAIATRQAGLVSAPSELSAAMQPASQGDRSEPISHRFSKSDNVLAGAPVMTVAALSADQVNADKPGKHGKSSSRKAKGHERGKVAHQSVQVAKAAKSAKSVRQAKAFKPPEPAENGRLVLDPVEAEALVRPNLQMSGALGSPIQADDASANVLARRQAAAAMWLALNATPEQMGRDRQRLMELEQRLAQLKQEGDQARLAVKVLEARVKQAESQPASGKVSMLLGLLALAGVGAAVYLWRGFREEQKRTDTWWQSQGEALESTPIALGHQAAEDTEPDTAPDLATVMPRPAAENKVAAARPNTPAQQAPVAKPIEPMRSVLIDASHQFTVEELIDLEQQAEFFMVLGQEEAVIGLLEGHVQHTAGGSPFPFLKLLEAYHRAGNKVEYERVSAEFSKLFETDAPAWDDYLHCMHNLADYPDVVERLQNIWFRPIEAMGMLDKTLTHPDPGACIFDLPAYRELLFLYAVARDLSEREAHDRTSVDLLMSVKDISGKAPERQGKQAARSESMIATRPIRAQPALKAEMEIDLPLEDLQVPADIHKP